MFPNIYAYKMNIIFKNDYVLLLNKLVLRHKSEIYPYSSETLNLLFKIQWVFVILLSLFVMRKVRATCSSAEMLKRCMVKERLGTPALKVDEEILGFGRQQRIFWSMLRVLVTSFWRGFGRQPVFHVAKNLVVFIQKALKLKPNTLEIKFIHKKSVMIALCKCNSKKSTFLGGHL